jgi:hypothetical protein
LSKGHQTPDADDWTGRKGIFLISKAEPNCAGKEHLLFQAFIFRVVADVGYVLYYRVDLYPTTRPFNGSKAQTRKLCRHAR